MKLGEVSDEIVDPLMKLYDVRSICVHVQWLNLHVYVSQPFVIVMHVFLF